MKKHIKARPSRRLRKDELFSWHLKTGGWNDGSRRPPAGPVGVLLREEFLRPLSLTPRELARAIPPHPDWPDVNIAESIRDVMRSGNDSLIDLHLALALDRYFGMRPGFFWGIQAEHEARERMPRERRWLGKIVPFKQGHQTRAKRPSTPKKRLS